MCYESGVRFEKCVTCLDKCDHFADVECDLFETLLATVIMLGKVKLQTCVS